ncbi:MAG: chalcone isomerase family protein [Acidobacteria bacterium]|nr:chalcone isomerase family protein [Acidobacteriota bacterium]
MRHHGKLNGELKGTIEGDDFAAALLRVWLGAKPPTEDFKEGMLGAG